MEIVIISGFLGGGKTTALNHLIENAKSQGQIPAVIMNEFGSKSVDSHLIDGSIGLSEIVNGCICCEMKSNVTNQLHEIYIDYQPDIVFIECSGIAHPLEVLDACLTPVLTPFSNVVSLTSVIDVHLFSKLAQLPKDIQNLIIAQMSYCSNFVLNKSDLISSDKLLNVIDTITTRHSNTPYFITSHGEVTLDNIKSDEIKKVEHFQGGKINHSTLGHSIFYFSHCWYKQSFINWVQALPNNIYRVKGFLTFEDSDVKKLVQYTNNNLNIVSSQLNIEDYVVVIGHNIDKEQLSNSIKHYHGLKLHQE
ncbi:GTP-binding protein [Staphylococcus gallinarum]|uniref:GTP-binding protein n=1 Tax=Staphylococcus gallinarum TaxID=1293 RepID=A0A3A0W535_STAGA|nr:GTP-binding protein [Staphylococcus gallinarum]RIP35017.1 GTP-binding protein [Staphylococcus gallinarum]